MHATIVGPLLEGGMLTGRRLPVIPPGGTVRFNVGAPHLCHPKQKPTTPLLPARLLSFVSELASNVRLTKRGSSFLVVNASVNFNAAQS